MYISPPDITEDQVAAADWRKSSLSGPFTDNCVEVAAVGAMTLVRSTRDRKGAILAFLPGEWDAFIAGAKAGEFDRARA